MFSFIGDNLAAIFLVLAGLTLLTLVIVQTFRINRLGLRIDALTGGADGDLETVLTEHLEIVHEVGRDLDELTARTAVLEASGRHHFTRQGLVRFNPFEDTGGNQSFALALLDESDDGFVISSLHSRTGTRIYAKVVSNGKAETAGAEESQAIEEARVKRNVGPGATGRAAASRTKAAAAAAVAEANESPKPAPPPKPIAVAVPAKPAPAPTKAAPAKAAPAPVKPVPARASAPAAAVHEIVVRDTSERIKGQSKSGVVIDPVAADSEKLGRKPGHRPVPGSG